MRRLKKVYLEFVNQGNIKNALLNQTKKEGNVIYGAQSIRKQIGIFGRGTFDYDILAKKPKQSANKTEKIFDKITRGDNYYVKPAQHPGTYKVMNKGWDSKKGTEDDVGVVDYTQMPKPIPRTKTINGVRYRVISEERKAKLKALRDKAYAFRHKKDKEDYDRIKLATGKLF